MPIEGLLPAIGDSVVIRYMVLFRDGNGLPTDRSRGQVARDRIEQGQVGAAERLVTVLESEPSGHIHVDGDRLRCARAWHAREVVDKGSATLRQLVATHLGHARVSERHVQ